MKLKKIQPKRQYYTSLYSDYVMDEIAKKKGKIVTNKPPMMGSRVINSNALAQSLLPFPPDHIFTVPDLTECPTAITFDEIAEWSEVTLNKINEYRTNNDALPLILNTNLNFIAQKTVNYINSNELLNQCVQRLPYMLNTTHIPNLPDAYLTTSKSRLLANGFFDVQEIQDPIEFLIYDKKPPDVVHLTFEHALNVLFQYGQQFYFKLIHDKTINRIGFGQIVETYGGFQHYIWNIIVYRFTSNIDEEPLRYPYDAATPVGQNDQPNISGCNNLTSQHENLVIPVFNTVAGWPPYCTFFDTNRISYINEVSQGIFNFINLARETYGVPHLQRSTNLLNVLDQYAYVFHRAEDGDPPDYQPSNPKPRLGNYYASTTSFENEPFAVNTDRYADNLADWDKIVYEVFGEHNVFNSYRRIAFYEEPLEFEVVSNPNRALGKIKELNFLNPPFKNNFYYDLIENGTYTHFAYMFQVVKTSYPGAYGVHHFLVTSNDFRIPATNTAVQNVNCISFDVERIDDVPEYNASLNAGYWPPTCNNFIGAVTFQVIQNFYTTVLQYLNAQRAKFGNPPLVSSSVNFGLLQRLMFVFQQVTTTQKNGVRVREQIESPNSTIIYPLENRSDDTNNATIVNSRLPLDFTISDLFATSGFNNLSDADLFYYGATTQNESAIRVVFSDPHEIINQMLQHTLTNVSSYFERLILDPVLERIAFSFFTETIPAINDGKIHYEFYHAILASPVGLNTTESFPIYTKCVPENIRRDLGENITFPVVCPEYRSYANLHVLFSDILVMINDERENMFLEPLVWHSDLSYLADVTNRYIKRNNLFLPGNGRYYGITSTDRDARFDQGIYTEAETTVERFTEINFIEEINTIPLLSNREYPITYYRQAIGHDPHDYFKDIIDGIANDTSDVLWHPDSRYIGFNYLVVVGSAPEDEGKQDLFYNIVVSAETNTLEQSLPFVDDYCFSNGQPLPPIVDPSFADPLTRPCPTYSHPQWPVICPVSYTYELMQSITASVIEEMNGYRIIRGMQPMIWNKNLTWAAQIQASYRRNNPGSGHDSPLSPHGANLGARVASSNFVGTSLAEGLWNFATNGGEPNIMQAFCLIRGDYSTDCTTLGHFKPMVNTCDVDVPTYNAIGIGWTRRVDQPSSGWVNCDVCVVYGNSTSDNQANAPSLEDPYILCTVSILIFIFYIIFLFLTIFFLYFLVG